MEEEEKAEEEDGFVCGESLNWRSCCNKSDGS